jgi:hypothetical protein
VRIFVAGGLGVVQRWWGKMSGRGRRWASGGRGAPWVAGVLVAAVVMVGAPSAPSEAAPTLRPGYSQGAVRIYVNGEFDGSGMLVDRNWALTVWHVVDTPDDAYSLRFGEVIGGDPDGNLRRVDRIVRAEGGADLALLHFADPVPEGTFIPSVAAQAPRRNAALAMYGWGLGGAFLWPRLALVYDPVARQNAAQLRIDDPEFAEDFPVGVEPMAVLVQDVRGGDSGNGLLTWDGVLTGIFRGSGDYSHVNETGNLSAETTTVRYQLPVWQFRDWIRRTINGEGSSGSQQGPPRRRLGSAESGGPPMTLPPGMDPCPSGGCTVSEPRWAVGFLSGSGQNRGTVQAVCVSTAGNSCSFNGTASAAGVIARLPLGTSKAPMTGPREVMVWCKATSAFVEGGPLFPVLRVSFTNAEHTEVPVGMGWWDVMTDQVGTGNGQAVVDPDQFATC